MDDQSQRKSRVFRFSQSKQQQAPVRAGSKPSTGLGSGSDNNGVKNKDQTHSARLEHIDGGNVLIHLTGGGTIPNMFDLETNQQGNLALTVGPEDEAVLDQLSKDFITMVLERRTEYVKTSTISNSSLMDCVKSILSEKTPIAENTERL